ncbi:hypothetical protein MNBD_GAMMA16-2115 [hydrothermal vent metagenome]|uniref:Uncharacterized protein n=1 Tax=hydrothermal vent metagenome TaxID=652676 RepID=A0A3B0ZHN8_9ZZZZ
MLKKTTDKLHFIAPATNNLEQATIIAKKKGYKSPLLLQRRGYQVCWLATSDTPTQVFNINEAKKSWLRQEAIYIPGYITTELADFQKQIRYSHDFYSHILNGESCDELFDAPYYSERLLPVYEMLTTTEDEADPQEIVTLEFDVLKDGELVAENLWVKLSWLSFIEDDSSFRLRFSFGIAGYENVAEDFQRQQHAGNLTEAIFPESALISQNKQLEKLLQSLLDIDQVAYVERIVYFNAPKGGAQLHQDVEAGHLGVVYAQLSGETIWITLAKASLVKEIIAFFNDEVKQAILKDEIKSEYIQLLKDMAKQPEVLSDYLDERENDPLEVFINQSPSFVRQLLDHGYAYKLSPGDLILLPQKSVKNCNWHCVYSASDHEGEALSFAIREAEKLP